MPKMRNDAPAHLIQSGARDRMRVTAHPVWNRRAAGAASPPEVERMAADRRSRLRADRDRIDAREQAIRDGEVMLSEAIGAIMRSA